ncbi:MAG: aminotransferase class V-fold PLP-dependent enzyme [Herminiimonas sp.]|nr:aminotransferase class V-fold PLP-dependent enzyme [Herminiimonas sp.]
MFKLNSDASGHHFLQIPGLANVPDRILRAMDFPTIDHRGPEFQIGSFASATWETSTT